MVFQRRPSVVAFLLISATLEGMLSGLAAGPQITSQPASQTIFYGDAVTFRVEASGTAPLSYQWFRNGVPDASATASTWTIPMVSSNDQGAGFWITVNDSSGMTTSAVAVLTVDYGIPGPPQTNNLLSYETVWRYDQTENLDGIDWTAPGYDDSSWPAGPGLLAGEDNPVITPLIRTVLDRPYAPPAGLNPGHAYYFRTTVNVPAELASASILATFRCDDGAVIYTNGNEAQRIRMALGTIIDNLSFATGFPPDPIPGSSGSDATVDESLILPGPLAAGTNALAVSVHQQNSSSSDIVWGLALDAIVYPRIRDTVAPNLSEIIPLPGGVVPSLKEIEVHFSEGVKGVKVGDLLINNSPATNVTAYSPDVYVFDFPQPPAGTVEVAWSATQEIIDLSANSNRFGGGSFSYSLNPAVVANSMLITEFMASNTQTVRDEDGHHSDWIELYNSGDQPVSLGRWYLTDDPTKLTKWQFPLGLSVPAKGYLLVWASGLDRTNPAAPLHTNFKLDKTAGNYLGLVYPDGSTVVSSFWPYPQQFDDISYGRDRLDPSLVGYFTNATPGKANSTLGPGFPPEVEFSVVSRSFQQPFPLVLSTTDTNATIRYLLVTNGTSAAVTYVPNSTSPVYTAPLPIGRSTLVRARAFSTQPGYLPGPLHSETYIQIAADAAGMTSDLPMVVFHDMGGSAVAATADQFMTMEVFETRNGRSSLLNPPDVAVQGYFHRRGQATFWNPKANLRVETQNAYGDNLDVELLGMPAENDWVFYGIDQFDKVLMHNPLTHELYREMGHYSPRTRFVEVYLKDDSGVPGPITRADYNGLYVLEEKIKISKNRVDIDKLQAENTTAPSVTGGYLLSIDKSNPGSPDYLANAAVWYLDPDYYEITAPERAVQLRYIENYFSDFYDALTGPNWTDPVLGYAAYIDVDSWIDCHLHNTFVFNVDMLRISSFFYKPRNGKIVQGPLWDFDRAFADSDDGRGFNPRRWRSAEGDGGTDPFNPGNTFNNPWYSQLFQDSDFWQRWIDRYQELRRNVYSLTNMYAKIDLFGNQVREATAREYARWRGSGGSDTSPRSGYVAADGFAYTFPSPGTWQGEINFTKYWFSNRLDFIDSNFLNPPAFSNNGGAISLGSDLTITAGTREAGSTIYYTLDGSDPRLPGGGVSPTALSSLNTATIKLTRNARVVARNWNATHHNLTGPNNPPISSSWSGPTSATFVVATPLLAITEIMYHPPGSGTNDGDNFEFIELKNVGSQDLSLIGIHFTDGIDFSFTATNTISSLGPGEYVVLVKDLAAFSSRYPGVTNIAGQYGGSLDNSGERLRLEGALKEPILDFSYNDSWYPATDGQGFSLVIRNELAPFNTWTNPASWRASSAKFGSPGRADAAPPNISSIVISEVLTHTDPPQVDTIELYNPTPNPVPIGGWFLTDDHQQPTKYRIPQDKIVPSGGYLLFDETQFNAAGSNAFSLSSLGEEVYLFSGDATNITGYRHGFEFGAQINGSTFGRYVTSDGREHFVTEKTASLGFTNAGPKIGPVILNEIMYAPPSFGLDPDTVDEYIELRNFSAQAVELFDPLHLTNTWHLDGGVQFTFLPGITMPPWSFLLLVNFDPAHDPAALNWFRSRYNLETNVSLFGPFQGNLANEGEHVGLYMPDKPEVPPSPVAGFVPYVLMEDVHYGTVVPWPANADRTGNSLQRVSALNFADEPMNWVAGTPSPGRVNSSSLSIDTDQDGLPDEWEIVHGLDPQDPTGNNGRLGDPDGDGQNNWQEYLAGTSPTDGQDYLRFDQVTIRGPYCVLEFTPRPGRTYAIEKVDASDAVSTWATLQGNISGTNSFSVSDLLISNGRFYRIKATLAP